MGSKFFYLLLFVLFCNSDICIGCRITEIGYIFNKIKNNCHNNEFECSFLGMILKKGEKQGF